MFKEIATLIRQYAGVRLDLMRITLAEGLTAIVGAILMCMIGALLAAVAVAFTTLALVHVLSIWLPMWASYLIMTGVLAATLPLVLRFKHQLIYDPIARIISSKIFPSKDNSEDETEE